MRSSDEIPIIKRRLTKRQRAVLKLLKIGAIVTQPHPKYKYRLLDDQRNPIAYLHGRTFHALLKKSLITKQKDGSYTAVFAKEKI